MPLTMKDEDNREWMAIGLNPESGEILWIPGDTEVVAFSLAEEGEDPDEVDPEVDRYFCLCGEKAFPNPGLRCGLDCRDDDPSDDQIPPPDGITGASPPA